MEQWRRNLYVTWFTQILSLAGFGLMLPFIPFFIQEVGVTDPDAVRRWVGLTASITAITLGGMGPVWGVLADRFGRKLMILRSMVAGALILFAMSFATSVGMIFVLRLLQGLFTGTVTAAATLVAAGTPRHRMASALGFLSSSTFIGFSLGPAIGGFTAEFVGYRTAFRIGALVLLVAFLLVLSLTRDVRAEVDPEKHLPSAGSSRERAARSRGFRIAFALALGLLFLIRFARALPASFIPLHVQEVRGTAEGASAITGVLSASLGSAAALAGLTVARLGDRTDKLKLITRLLFGATFLAAPLYFTGGLWDFGIVYVAVAFVMGGVEPNLQSYLSEYTESSKRGVIFGTLSLVGGLGWFFAPLVGSAISISLGIRWIFLFFAAAVGLAWLYVLIVRKPITSRLQASARSE